MPINFRRASIFALLPCLLAVAHAAPTNDPIPANFKIVAQDDCGNPKAQPQLTVGGSWTIAADKQAEYKLADLRDINVSHGPTVTFRYGGLRKDAQYMLRVREMNDGPERAMALFIDGVEIHAAHDIAIGVPQIYTYKIPAETFRDAVVAVEFRKTGGAGAMVSAIELWSDQQSTIGPVGSFMRFRVDAFPEKITQWKFTGSLRIHNAPWVVALTFTPNPVTATGYTEWIDLNKLPGRAVGPITLNVPKDGKGATQFSLMADEAMMVRELDWNEPDGTMVIVDAQLANILTFREQERRYYLSALEQAGTVRPLARPPLLFANAWGWAPPNANEYMVKSFRLLGMNSVASSTDRFKYADLYGWGIQDAVYHPPYYLPFDEKETSAKYDAYYKEFFEKGDGKNITTRTTAYQLADEPREGNLVPAQAQAGFVAYLQANGKTPQYFGKATWDEVTMAFDKGQGKLFYWSHKYQGQLIPKVFAQAAQAFVKNGPNPKVRPYVALSGHSFNMSSRLPLDMFELAKYPDVMPGISDWMTGGSWWWDSHQSVAWSVAPYNAGARRYGADYGKTPTTFPMMHNVWPSIMRAFTQLGNNCKLISYYNYGPDYVVTEGMWSNGDGSRYNVNRVNNMSAKVDDILGPGHMRPSRVAQLYTMSNEYWAPATTFSDHRPTFLSLTHDYFSPDLITEDQIAAGALQHYDALYVLDQWITKDAEAAIEKWVKAGGMLWTCGDSLTFNQYNEKSDLLSKMAGLERDFTPLPPPAAGEAAPVKATLIKAAPGQPEFEEHNIPPYGIHTKLSWPGATVRGVYNNGAPAWLEGKVGKGKVVYLGLRPGIAYAWRGAKAFDKRLWPANGRTYLTGPLLEAGIERELSLSTPLVMASPISTTDGTVVVLYNLTNDLKKDVTMRLKEPKAPHSVQIFDANLNLVDIPFTYENGFAVAIIPEILWNGQMVVVRRQPAPADDRLAIMRAAAEKNLASTEWEALSAGAWFASFFPDWKLAPKIVPLLAHEHWAVRRSAAEALGRLGHTAAGPALLTAAEKEQDCNALADEVGALVALKHPAAAGWVEKLKVDKNQFLRGEGERLGAVK